jgi:hypothetical protein
VSVNGHHLFEREAKRTRGDSRPTDIAATDQDSQGRSRSKRGGDPHTKESIATQHEDGVHQSL